jgi:hypothetical protein
MHWAFSARSTRQRGALAVVMTAWFALLMYWQPIAIHNTLVNSQKVRMAHIAYTIGMTDWRTHPLLSIPHRAEKRNPALDWKPYLQSTGNGIFAQSASHWAGQYVIESARRLPACIGNVAMTPLDNGFSAVRIGITHGARPAAAWVLDEHQQVIGYALRALPGGLFDDTTALAGYSATVDQWTVIGNPEHAPCLLGQSL